MSKPKHSQSKYVTSELWWASKKELGAFKGLDRRIDKRTHMNVPCHSGNEHEKSRVMQYFDDFMEKEGRLFHVFDEYSVTTAVVTYNDVVRLVRGIEALTATNCVCNDCQHKEHMG